MKLALGHLGTEFAPRFCVFDTDNGRYWGVDDPMPKNGGGDF